MQFPYLYLNLSLTAMEPVLKPSTYLRSRLISHNFVVKSAYLPSVAQQAGS